jgi:hypothetical protein
VLLKGDDKRQAAQADGVRRGVGRKGDEALSLVWRGWASVFRERRGLDRLEAIAMLIRLIL